MPSALSLPWPAMGRNVTTGRPTANASLAVRPPAFSTMTSHAAMSRGHVVAPAEDRAVAARAELGLQLLVAAADDDGMEVAGGDDRVDGARDVADAPRTGDHQHAACVGREPELGARRGAVGRIGGPEAVADERAGRAGVVAATRRGRSRPRTGWSRGGRRRAGAPRAGAPRSR